MQPLRTLIAAAGILAMAGAGVAWADPHKDESGHGRGGGFKEERKYDSRTGEEKYEWKSGDCKYERKSGPKGHKEEYKCGYPRHAGGPPPWAPAHGYRKDEYRHYGLAAPPIDLGAGRCNREVIGQLLGGAVGAAAGSQIGDGRGRLAAVAAGTLVGVLIGGEVGRGMDRADALCIDQALEHARDGETIAWAGGDHRYELTPQGTFQAAEGRYCREYQARSTVGDEIVRTHGTACRQPDGSWQIVN